jgi:hypothetical protein
MAIDPVTGKAIIDPAFKRDLTAEAAAIAAGVATKAEIEARGGVNAAGYYGDSFDSKTSLTDAEYAAAIAGKTGAAQGAAVNEAINKKVVASGLSGAGAGTGAGAGGSDLKDQAESRSAYALLLSEFARYGLDALVTPLQDLIKQGISGPEFQIALRNTDAYQKRFIANTDRIKKGLVALSPAEYLALEDGYQSLMRNYGLPASYYTKDSLGTQSGFNKLIANDV